jgi:hypothetical protein
MNMKFSGKFASFAGALGMLGVQPAQACWSDSEANAASVANLNMMMMVTALRCRNGPDNFLAEYNQFVKTNNATLGAQNALIKSRFARMNGAAAAEGAMDRFTIGLANRYGGGTIDKGCSELKVIAGNLASKGRDAASLIAIANVNATRPSLPGGSCSTRVAER